MAANPVLAIFPTNSPQMVSEGAGSGEPLPRSRNDRNAQPTAERFRRRTWFRRCLPIPTDQSCAHNYSRDTRSSKRSQPPPRFSYHPRSTRRLHRVRETIPVTSLIAPLDPWLYARKATPLAILKSETSKHCQKDRLASRQRHAFRRCPFLTAF